MYYEWQYSELLPMLGGGSCTKHARFRRTRRLQSDANLRFAPVGAAEPQQRWPETNLS